MARLLYHLARGRKMDLETHIFDFVRELATSVDSHRTIMFPCMISEICLKDGVPLLPFEETDTPDAPLNYKTTDNLEAKMGARENRAQHALAVQPDEKAHDLTHLAPQLALA
ncbi:hypothetical protein Adt_39876 [Abeliophyllum distichum]|uniref:Uncharacterized protein n=1 Tax=Abeliophyllum distichum TaxID=126358 RepID=A0ABD1Q6D3_9LAMI